MSDQCPFSPPGGDRKKNKRYPREAPLQDGAGWKLRRLSAGANITGEPGTNRLLSLLAKARKCLLSRKQHMLSSQGRRGCGGRQKAVDPT